MGSAPLPHNEANRLLTLHELQILESNPEAPFDRIVAMTQQIFDAPIVQISLVDEHREWFKAQCGNTTSEGDREVAFCAHAIMSDELLVVEDATKDPRFCDSPLVAVRGLQSYVGAPLRTSNGSNVGALCVKDFRPRKYTAVQLNQLREFAALVVDVMELRLFRLRADAANQSKSEFLSNMSHEIRTPLTGIMGFSEQLLDESLSHTQRRLAAQTVRRNGENLLTILNDILDLSKIEAGRMTVERIQVSLCQIVAEVISLMEVRAQAAGISLGVDYEGEVPETILTDPLRLRQILLNMLGNAIKFTLEGGVRLVIRFLDGSRSTMQFDVVDTGIGISRAHQSGLFEAFAQADNSTTRSYGGTGLGLTISRRLARLLGGDLVLVDSQSGLGTRFRAIVEAGPVDGVRMLSHAWAETHTKVVIEELPFADQAVPHLAGMRILLAEDNTDNQRLFRLILARAGADMVIAANGLEAVLQATSALKSGQPFDMILMDMQMPVMDGYTATEKLRGDGYGGEIVALTAHAMSGEREKCLRAGCSDYATKPVDRNALIKQIARRVSARRKAMNDVPAVTV